MKTRFFQREAVWAIGVMLVALVVRATYMLETQEVPTARHLVGDAAGYYQWAREIAGGAWFGTEPFYQAPLYPYVLASGFKIFGDSVGTIRGLQAVWGAAACGLMYFGTSRLFGRGAGVVAGMMLALYGPAIFFDGIVQKASLTGLLACALFAAVTWNGTYNGMEDAARRLRSGFGHGPASAWLVGFVGALLAITRENAMVWLPILGVWVWCDARDCRLGKETSKSQNVKKSKDVIRRGNWAAVGAYVLGAAMVLGPVGIRNRVVGGEWSVSTFQAGPNFYIGNHRGADGRYRPLVKGHETPQFERADATKLAQEAVGRSLSAREMSRYWMGKAWEEIGADWGAWLRLMCLKAAMVWNRYEVSDVESPYVYRESSAVLSVLGRGWHFGVLCPLAAVGFAATWSDRRRLWVYYALIVSMAAAVAAFYVLARYRYPLALLLIPFAAAGCVEIWKRVRSGSFQSMAGYTAVAAAVAVAVNWPVHDERKLNAMARMNAGVALAEAGELGAAETYFREALGDHPGSAEGHNNLAQAMALRGDFAGAVQHYEAALSIEPALVGADYNLGVALERVGRIADALRAYERAVARDSADADARAAVKRLSNGE